MMKNRFEQIKKLIKPGETVQIYNGDKHVFTFGFTKQIRFRQPDSKDFKIVSFKITKASKGQRR